VALVLQTIDSDGVGTLTLNDEANLNAMSDEMAREFSVAVSELKKARNLRSVILTGAGKAFSAGGHLAMLEAKRAKSREENRTGMLEFYNSFLCARDLNVPLIAAINGTAVGAGLCVACACDFRVASDSTKLGFTFLKLGLHPGMGATYFVPRVVGPSLATELLLTGRVIGADEALRVGMLSRVVPGSEVMKAARSIAEEILACGPEATSQLLQTMRGDPAELARALDREAECQSVNYAGAEFAEGICAVKEKRSPSFAKR